MARVVPKLSTVFTNRATRAVLGTRYELSVAYVSRGAMRAMNRRYRARNAPTDILSFPLSKYSGEIVFCLEEVKTHARAFGVDARTYLPFLFIHGLVHLKGHAHGRIMDRLELAFCKKFDLWHPHTHGGPNRSRNRRGDLSGSRRRR